MNKRNIIIIAIIALGAIIGGLFGYNKYVELNEEAEISVMPSRTDYCLYGCPNAKRKTRKERKYSVAKKY